MVKKWQIYYLDFNPVTGSEQKGVRPALIISNDNVNKYLPVFTVLPISPIKPKMTIYPTEIFLSSTVTGLPKDSVAMVQQIRTVSYERIKSLTKVGEITSQEYKTKINQALIEYFELD